MNLQLSNKRESFVENDYVLRKTGRFAHSPAYIQRLAKDHGFIVKASESIGLRKEEGRWIKGELYNLKYQYSLSE